MKMFVSFFISIFLIFFIYGYAIKILSYEIDDSTQDNVFPLPIPSYFHTVENLYPPEEASFLGFQRDASAILLKKDEPNYIFYILIHGTFSGVYDSKTPGHLWGEDEFTELIPAHFFGEYPEKDTVPVRLAFGWDGKLSDESRKTAGEKLANGINAIKKQIKKNNPDAHVYLLLVGHSHGGNVINVASQKIKEPIERVIQLATPVLAYDSKTHQFNNSNGYYPHNFDQLIIYYSMQDFVQSGGALESSFKRRYGPVEGINIYNVRLRVEGNDPLHIKMHDHLIGKNILALTKKIQNIYKTNHNLIAHITHKKPGANLLIAIKPYVKEKNILYDISTGPSTDTYWPLWEGQNQGEKLYNRFQRKLFQNIYQEEIDHQPGPEERLEGALESLALEKLAQENMELKNYYQFYKDQLEKYPEMKAMLTFLFLDKVRLAQQGFRTTAEGIDTVAKKAPSMLETIKNSFKYLKSWFGIRS